MLFLKAAHNPLVPGSSPDGTIKLKGYILETSFTVCTGHIVNTLGPNGLGPGASAENASGLLRYLASIAHLQDVHFLWRPFLRDPDDDMVLECAVASGSQFIITHNTKDFKRAPELRVNAITPAEFLTLLRSKS